MENLINILNSNGVDIVAFYNSTFFSIVKFILGIYSVVVLADIVLMLIQRGLSGDLRETSMGMNIPPELVKRKGKLRKIWNVKVREKMQGGEEANWKIAIIQADGIIDDLIKRMGYSGENMSERLAEINPGQIENIEELKKAHAISNQIVKDDDFILTKEQAEETIGYFENFLKYFEVL